MGHQRPKLVPETKENRSRDAAKDSHNHVGAIQINIKAEFMDAERGSSAELCSISSLLLVRKHGHNRPNAITADGGIGKRVWQRLSPLLHPVKSTSCVSLTPRVPRSQAGA
eukprot:3656455-Rhodomonas_salina.1